MNSLCPLFRLRCSVLSVLCCVLLSTHAPDASAQALSLRGSVVDESGGAIAGADVTLLGADGTVRGRTATSAAGSFAFEGVPAGKYVIDVEKALFDTTHVGVDLADNATVQPLRIVLQVGGVREAVTVAVPKVDERPTGQTVTTIDRDLFKDVSAASIGDVILYSPGVTVSQANGPRDVLISVRGSNARVTFGLRNIQVFEDGFPVTQSDGLARTDLTDPHAYSSIDVLRGPSSALYGNYAVEGAINFHLRRAEQINGIDGGVDLGSFGYRNYNVAYGHKGSSYEITAFGSGVTGDGFTSHTSYTTATANILATFTPSPANTFTLKFINNDMYPNLSIRLSLNQYNANPYQAGCAALAAAGCASVSVFANGVTGPRVNLSADQAGLQRHDRRTIIGARWEHALDSDTTWRTQLVFDNRDIKQPTSAMSAVGTFPSFNVTSDVTRAGHLGGRKAVHFAGFFANFENNNSDTFNVAPGGDATLGALTATTIGHHFNIGLRAREEVQVASTVTASVGAGIERTELLGQNVGYAYPATAAPAITRIEANRTLTNVAPEATIAVQPSRKLRVQARVATAYGTPQIGNLFVTPEGLNGNNTQLTSQRSVGLDLSADVTFGTRLRASVAGYTESYRNELVTQSPGPNLLSYTFNAPRSVHRGFEAMADWQLFGATIPGARLRASYTWMDQYYSEYVERLSAGNSSTAFDRSGNKIPGVTPNTLNARASYDLLGGLLEGLGAYAEVTYRGRTWVDNANLLEMPGYTLMNVGLHYDGGRVGSGRAALHYFLDARNVTNRIYIASASNLSDSISSLTGSENPATALANIGGIWAGAPRSYVGGVRVTF